MARDRARRVGWNLERVLQERRLAWRGADIGMSSLRDDADQVLGEIAADARDSMRRRAGGAHPRPRARASWRSPSSSPDDHVATSAEQAARLETERRDARKGTKALERRIADHLTAALRRLGGVPGDVRREAAARRGPPDRRRTGPDPRGPGCRPTLGRSPAADSRRTRPVWRTSSSPSRTHCTGCGPWHVRPARERPQPGPGPWPGRPDPDRELPPPIERAARVLGYLHPVPRRGSRGGGRGPDRLHGPPRGRRGRDLRTARRPPRRGRGHPVAEAPTTAAPRPDAAPARSDERVRRRPRGSSRSSASYGCWTPSCRSVVEPRRGHCRDPSRRIGAAARVHAQGAATPTPRRGLRPDLPGTLVRQGRRPARGFGRVTSRHGSAPRRSRGPAGLLRPALERGGGARRVRDRPGPPR